MLDLLRRVFGSASTPPQAAAAAQALADPVICSGGQSLDLLESADWHEGLPHPDWSRVADWLQVLP